MPLTKRQKQILDFIEGYLEEWGYAPNFEEIAHAFGYASLATVHEHLSNLERKGYIRKAYNQSRSIEMVHRDADGGIFALPLLGAVAAGCPSRPFRTPKPCPSQRHGPRRRGKLRPPGRG